ncbi:MAG: hypothetical protein WD052_11935 [Bacteroidales bacterium]
MRYPKYLYGLLKLLILALVVSLTACTGNLSQALLFEDEFDQLPEGYISSGEEPLTRHLYIPGSGRIGDWTVPAFGKEMEFNKAWQVVPGEDGNFLRQNYHAVDNNLRPLNSHTHPMIIAGDSLWQDYKIEFSFRPMQLSDKCGVVFKYQNSRCYYFYGMEGNMLVLKLIQHATAPYRPYEKILKSVPFKWEAGELYNGDVSIKQNRIYTLLNDSLSIIADDNTYHRGKVGFLSDVPAEFLHMEVSTLNRERRKLTRYKRELANAKSMRINENITPVVWKKIATPGFGTGKNIRFGDLTGNGEIDLLIGQVELAGKNELQEEINCLTAMTFDGEVLWQRGSPGRNNYMNSEEVAFQVHDIDGNGSKEVIYIRDHRMYVLEGKSGRTIRSVRIPSPANPGSESLKTTGNFIFFCDLQGKERDSNLLVRYRGGEIIAYNEHLQILWRQPGNQGYFPFAKDIDGDGMDEIAIGYSLFDHDGTLIWNRGGIAGDDAKAVIIASPGYDEDTTLKIIYGAGDWGTMILDMDGKVSVHHPVGHVQNLSMANFRTDIPGLEMVSSNFWGNQGIIHFYDASGKIYHSFEPGPYGTQCLPVNWRGDGQEYMLLNTNPGDGGLFNGRGQLVVPFPDDGHPDLCNAVIDLTGDARDEIVTWDINEIWVYTQEDNTRQGRIYNPLRNRPYNYSNYQFTISKPRWSD